VTDEEARRTGPVIFISVGEPSGDLHGAKLARALRERMPDARLIGLGGPLMVAAGVELIEHVDNLAVMGFVEVVSRLPFFLRLRRRVFAALDHERVDLVIPIDYPGFNLRLARHAHEHGRRVLYYIAPQVWAWHASRAADLARDTDAVAVILPFEEELFREHGAKVDFVGHPLLDRAAPATDRTDWCRRHGIDADRPLLALMPGSRRQELARHLGLFREAAERVVARHPGTQVLIGGGPGLPDDAFAGAGYRVIRDSIELVRHATVVLAKSGTTTLEVALAGTPFVVAYRVNPLTYRIARRLIQVPHIALANLVAGRTIVPEFVQHAATPAALSESLLRLMDPESKERAEMLGGLREIRSALGTPGAGDRVARIAESLIRAG
jgi:lipid-A-disaccharide synthase